jgi:hypothetical protein
MDQLTSSGYGLKFVELTVGVPASTATTFNTWYVTQWSAGMGIRSPSKTGILVSVLGLSQFPNQYFGIGTDTGTGRFWYR